MAVPGRTGGASRLLDLCLDRQTIGSLWSFSHDMNVIFVVISHGAVQVPSPNGQLVSSVPLEQTPAEEESRKSLSRSFKGTMASSTEREYRRLFFNEYSHGT